MDETDLEQEEDFDSLEHVFEYLRSPKTPDLAGDEQEYERGESIYTQGQLDCHIYRLDSGLLVQTKEAPADDRPEQEQAEGNHLAYNFVKPGDIFSTYLLSQNAVEQPCKTEALLASNVECANRVAFKDVLSLNSDLYLSMIDDLTDELQQRDSLLGTQTNNDSCNKIMTVLGRLAPLAPESESGNGQRIDFLEQRQLAEMTGLTEETISRKMDELETRGKIERKQGSDTRYALLIKEED